MDAMPDNIAKNEKKEREKGQKKRKVLFWVFTFVCLILAAALLLYVPVASYVSKRRQEREIDDYIKAVDRLSEEEIAKIRNDALEYNVEFAKTHPHVLAELYGQAAQDYPTELSVPGTDVIAYVEIPDINVRLPIYHYASDESMEKGCGHLDMSSLPIGGENAHILLLAHRNMTTALMFNRLDELEKGDVFSLTVLNETMTYEVDDIRVIEATITQEIFDSVRVEEEKEYCTLATCTPDGKTTHRLLVRGVRIS